MLESPAGSWKEPSDTQATPKFIAQDTQYGPRSARSSAPDETPIRQDSAYYSTKGLQGDEAEVDGEIQARQIRARERIAILRSRVQRTRKIRRERRADLRQLREHAREALDKLTRKINELVALGRLQEEISPYYERLRATQDDLGPAEDAYDVLERRLDEEEQDLEQEEDYFYRHNEVGLPPVTESKLDDAISPLVKPYNPPETEVQNLTLENSLLEEFLAKVEVANRLKEELDDLEVDYRELSGDASFRKRHNIPLSAETAKFLDDYPKLYANLIENLRDVEDAVFDLRDNCLKQGLFTDSEHIYEHRDALCEDVMDSVEEARDRSPLRVAVRHHEYPEQPTKFGDKRDYINNWLLEWIQQSTVDALMLKTWIYFKYPDISERAKELDGDKWSELAVENWNNDSAGLLTNENYNASRLDAITGHTGRLGVTSTGRSGVSDSLRSLDVAFNDEGQAEGVIVGSETGSYAIQKVDSDSPDAQHEAGLHADEITPKTERSRNADFFFAPSYTRQSSVVDPQSPLLKRSSSKGFLQGLDSPRRTLDFRPCIPSISDHTIRRTVSFQGP